MYTFYADGGSMGTFHIPLIMMCPTSVPIFSSMLIIVNLSQLKHAILAILTGLECNMTRYGLNGKYVNFPFSIIDSKTFRIAAITDVTDY